MYTHSFLRWNNSQSKGCNCEEKEDKYSYEPITTIALLNRAVKKFPTTKSILQVFRYANEVRLLSLIQEP